MRPWNRIAPLSASSGSGKGRDDPAGRIHFVEARQSRVAWPIWLG